MPTVDMVDMGPSTWMLVVDMDAHSRQGCLHTVGPAVVFSYFVCIIVVAYF